MREEVYCSPRCSVQAGEVADLTSSKKRTWVRSGFAPGIWLLSSVMQDWGAYMSMFCETPEQKHRVGLFQLLSLRWEKPGPLAFSQQTDEQKA